MLKTKQQLTSFILSILFILISTEASSQSQSEQSFFGIYSAYSVNSHFIGEIGLTEGEWYEYTDANMDTLNANYTRYSLIFVWPLIDPNNNGNYNWNVDPCYSDSLLINQYEQPNDIHCLAVITPGMGTMARNPLDFPTEWQNFLIALAERYDGDGINDASSDIHLKYFQLCNEMQDWQNLSFGTPANYATIANGMMTSIRTEISNAEFTPVACFSNLQAGQVDPLFKALLDECSNQSVDIYSIDIHHWAFLHPDTTISWQMENITQMRSYLNSIGYTNTEIWSCEHAAYQGQAGSNYYISEDEQACWLIKSFNYNKDNGLDKQMWSQLVDNYNFDGNPNSPFNTMGLISDGYVDGVLDVSRRNTKRVTYWVYKMMAEKTDNHVATLNGEVTEVHNGTNIFAYEYTRLSDSKKFYIIWSENGSQIITLNISLPYVHVTDMITDRFGNILNEYNLSATGGQVNITIDSNPLLVEEIEVNSIEEETGSITPNEFRLNQNYPNPFNPQTTISYQLPVNGDVALKIYNMLGQEVRTLINENKPAGYHSVVWNGKNELGERVSSGIYFYSIKLDNNYSITNRMLLLK